MIALRIIIIIGNQRTEFLRGEFIVNVSDNVIFVKLQFRLVTTGWQ